jgi:hypothetical protein
LTNPPVCRIDERVRIEGRKEVMLVHSTDCETVQYSDLYARFSGVVTYITALIISLCGGGGGRTWETFIITG